MRAVGGFLDRAVRHCSETRADPDDFVHARLFDDMAPFHFQIEAAGIIQCGVGGREDRRVRPARTAARRRSAFTSGILILSFSLPNFYFHVVTAYDILRTRGVPLGKRDYEGRLRTRTA